MPIIQIDTAGTGHLDADMITAALKNWFFGRGPLRRSRTSAISSSPPATTSANTCGSSFFARAKATKGDRYPAILQGSDALVITKAALRRHVNFHALRIAADLRRLRPDAAVLETYSVRGDGVVEVATGWPPKSAARRPSRIRRVPFEISPSAVRLRGLPAGRLPKRPFFVRKGRQGVGASQKNLKVFSRL